MLAMAVVCPQSAGHLDISTNTYVWFGHQFHYPSTLDSPINLEVLGSEENSSFALDQSKTVLFPTKPRPSVEHLNIPEYF